MIWLGVLYYVVGVISICRAWTRDTDMSIADLLLVLIIASFWPVVFLFYYADRIVLLKGRS